MIVPIEVKTERYFRCPNECEKIFIIEHLFDLYPKYWDRKFGPWYCEKCFQGWMFEINQDGLIQINKCKQTEENSGKCISCVVELEIPPQSAPIKFLVKGMRFKDEIDEELKNHHQFHYEENTSGVNIFHNVIKFSLVEQDDPFIFKYIDTRDETEKD